MLRLYIASPASPASPAPDHCSLITAPSSPSALIDRDYRFDCQIV
ncbi:MAG: hypothetical protein RIE73_30835 [Coleofasciculus sp. C1-SOL-03]